jgi:Xaa-Pro aminopeptidase
MSHAIEICRRLSALRAAMQAAGCAAYLIPASDPHASEYLPAHYNAREYFSGFACENSTLVVTLSEAALWVDGRYFVAAEAALRDTGISMMRIGVSGSPSVETYCAEALASGQVLGANAALLPLKTQRALESALAPKNCALKFCALEDILWTKGRPALPATPAFVLEARYTGLTPAEKLSAVREKLRGAGCTALLVNRLDSVGWLCNLRAMDIPKTPYALAFCWITQQVAVLFLNDARLAPEGRAALEEAGFLLRPYGEAAAFVQSFSHPETVLADPGALTAALYNALEENKTFTVREGSDPIQLLKAVKNETELACTRRAHLRDAVCMVRFQIELEKRLASSAPLREYDLCEILYRLRSADPEFVCLSFAPIAAWGENAAMMHYMPQKDADSLVERHGFLLVDSGTTCRDGTTDITRTYAAGPLTAQEKIDYTRVLKCHIDMARAVWREGATGGELDMLARAPLWRHLLDYRCGTGHGVAHVGSVHEGPQSLRPHNSTVFVPGMIVTDEPGLYEGGRFGIRIENELECVDIGDSEYGHFLGFRPLTWVPYDLAPLVAGILDEDELTWLNEYHASVLEKLSPLLTPSERGWLAEKCRPCRL